MPGLAEEKIVKRIALFLIALGCASCGVLPKPMPEPGDFPLPAEIIGLAPGCPSLAGRYREIPSVERLLPSRKEVSLEYVRIWLFSLGELKDQPPKYIELESPLARSDFFIRIVNLDSQLLLDTVYGDGSKLVRRNITALIASSCDEEGMRRMPLEEDVGGSEGVHFNERRIKRIGKTSNGDLLIELIVTHARRSLLPSQSAMSCTV